MSLLAQLPAPIVVAPMAGGPSTPELVTAVGNAGGFGFLAAGTASVDALATQVEGMQDAAGSVPFGVNLFCRQNPYPTVDHIRHIAKKLRPAFAERGLERPAVPDVDYDFGWQQKIDTILTAGDTRPGVVSCTFGCFHPKEIGRFHRAGIEAWVTVTNERDAMAAQQAGADALVVQGPAAGGHRSTWTVEAVPDLRPLAALVKAVAKQVGLPLIATGGITTPEQVARTLELPGVEAVACGTAFLLAAEAGTSARNRSLLRAGGETESTRAFSGRFARGIATEFTRDNRELPPAYPHLDAMLRPLRDDPAFGYCLAGEGFRDARAATAQEIVEHLAGAL